MIEDIHVGVSGGTPGADSNEYTLFDSTVAFGGGLLPVKGINRAQFTVNNTQAGSLKSYFSPDKGVTWNLNSTTAVSANAGITGDPYDFAISGAIDWKLTWVNGGVAQTPWQPGLTLSRGQKALSF
jgi:hypothetical protein